MKHEAKDINFKDQRKLVEEFFKTTEWKNAAAQGWGG